MPLESQLAHRVFRSANLPYVSNASPASTDPIFIPGSKDILCTTLGYATRRPGFADYVETTPTTFTNLQNQQCFEFTGGVFVEFANEITSNSSVVYKRQIGTDASYVSVFTDAASTNEFQFTASNNTVYFSNGNVAKKYTPANGVSNWGISIGSVNDASTERAGSGTNGAGSGTSWTNPGNVTSTTSYATAALTGLTSTLNDDCAAFGFSIPATTTITGIGVTADVIVTDNNGQFALQLVKNGNLTGNIYTVFPGTSATTISMGGTSDLWGTTWVQNDFNQTTFGVAINASAGHAFCNFSLRNVQITIYGIGGPSVAVSGSSGTFSATVGYQYVFCYGNSNSGHISSPSPASASTGVFTSKLNVSVGLTASTDTQVNQIRVYRSTDSVTTGTVAGTFFELPTSPYPNTTQNITDNAADISLNTNSLAPTFTFNDPPLPGTCATYFAGRIWMIVGNSVVFSGNEEITAGVPEESFPSGRAGNYWTFNEPPQALAVAGTGSNQGLLIFCGGWVFGISGNTLDTFQRFVVSQRRGCRNIKAVTALGGMVAWRDSSGQVWATDGNSLSELGIDIRPDLTPYTPGSDSMTFHVQGMIHWLLVSTGTQIFAYDLDLGTWMPPWSFACNHLFSGETAPGQYNLLASTSTKALQLSTTGEHNDIGVTYTPIIRTALMSLVPDFGTKFSIAAVGFYDEPSRTGTPYYFQVDTNSVELADVAYIADDDPQLATTYKSVASQQTVPEQAFMRGQGVNLRQNVFAEIEPTSRWMSWQITGKNADDNLKIYSYFMAYKQTR